MSSEKPQPTSRSDSPLSYHHRVTSVRDELKISSVVESAQTQRKSLQLLKTTHEAVYGASKGHRQHCTVSCPELITDTSHGQEVVYPTEVMKAYLLIHRIERPPARKSERNYWSPRVTITATIREISASIYNR